MKVKLSILNNFDSLSSDKFLSYGAKQKLDVHPKDKIEGHYKDTSIATNKIKIEKDCININRPTESVSFSGSAASRASRNGLTFFEKLARSEKFNKILDFTERNESKVSAVISLGMAGILKPICVLAMPGAEKEDKQFTATKNALSALIGYILSCAVLDPISYGVNEFLDYPEKYLKKGSKVLEQLTKDKEEGFKVLTKDLIKQQGYATNTLNSMRSFYKKGLGLLVAPAKAAITIALMPYVMKFIFGDRKKKKAEEQEQQAPLYMEPLLNPMANNMISASISQNKVFDAFTKGGNK